jgi:hypothetical protein
MQLPARREDYRLYHIMNTRRVYIQDMVVAIGDLREGFCDLPEIVGSCRIYVVVAGVGLVSSSCIASARSVSSSCWTTMGL